MLPLILQELKNTLGKLAIAVNLEAIQFEFWTERSISDSGNLCLFYLILRSGVLMFHISNINQCVKNFLRLRKADRIY